MESWTFWSHRKSSHQMRLIWSARLRCSFSRAQFSHLKSVKVVINQHLSMTEISSRITLASLKKKVQVLILRKSNQLIEWPSCSTTSSLCWQTISLLGPVALIRSACYEKYSWQSSTHTSRYWVSGSPLVSLMTPSKSSSSKSTQSCKLRRTLQLASNGTSHSSFARSTCESSKIASLAWVAMVSNSSQTRLRSRSQSFFAGRSSRSCQSASQSRSFVSLSQRIEPFKRTI